MENYKCTTKFRLETFDQCKFEALEYIKVDKYVLVVLIQGPEART